MAWCHSNFQVCIFTASLKEYADAILKLVDPHEDYTKIRYYRKHCFDLKTISEFTGYVKDLRIFQKRLEDVLLVDNTAYSFMFQISNGVPVPTEFAENDLALIGVLNHLKMAKKAEDWVKFNQECFGLEKLAKELNLNL